MLLRGVGARPQVDDMARSSLNVDRVKLPASGTYSPLEPDVSGLSLTVHVSSSVEPAAMKKTTKYSRHLDEHVALSASILILPSMTWG